MLKPAMIKHFLTILLLLPCLLFTVPAEARLTLGIVPGTQDSSGEISPEQAQVLAELLTEKLQEEVVIKELADSATLINWIDRFAMLDLALLSSKDVEANPGRFLWVGTIHAESDLLLVSRQGISGVWLQRAAKVLRAQEASPPETAQQIVSQPSQEVDEKTIPGKQEPLLFDEVIPTHKEPEQVPESSPGPAPALQEGKLDPDIVASEEPALKTLVLGVIPDPVRLLSTTEQARSLAIYLEQTLPVSVTVREFENLRTLSEWFMRYRMVDLAILPHAHAERTLGRDYQPLVKLLRSDKPTEESAELVIMRRGQHPELLGPLQQALFAISQAPDGQALMKTLSVSKVLAPGDTVDLPAVVETRPEPVQKRPAVPVPVPEEIPEPALEEPPSETAEDAEPLEPLAPPTVEVKPLPAIPQPAQLPVVPSAEVTRITIPELPVEKTKPSEPAEPAIVNLIELPETTSPAQEPFKPTIPLLPPVAAERTPTESPAAVKPPAVPQLPIAQEALAKPQEEVAQAIAPDPEQNVTGPDEVSAPQPSEEAELVTLPDGEKPLESVDVIEPPVTAASLDGGPVDETLEPVLSEPLETESDFVETIVLEPELPPVTAAVPIEVAEQEQDSAADAGSTKEFSSEDQFKEAASLSDDDANTALLDSEILAFLGENTVAAMVAQPDIPQALRPPGIPAVRPSRAAEPVRTTEELIVASLPEPARRTFPEPLPQLLPDLVPEPGIIYVIPFAAVMVPNDFNARFFDQFVDQLNQGGQELGLQFVILKEDLQRVDSDWLAVRRYVTGEIYGYVEDSGCCSTDLRTKVRLIYRRPKQDQPAFRYEYPVRTFFEHDQSTIDAERSKVAEEIALNLSTELLKVLGN